MNKNKPKYISAPCGAGKTYSVLQQAERLLALKSPTAIVVPSIVLQEEIAKKIRKDFKKLKYKVFNNENGNPGENKGVTRRIVDYLKTCPDDTLLIITHEAFLRIRYWMRADKWNIFIDEEMEPIKFLTLDIGHRNIAASNSFKDSWLTIFDELFDLVVMPEKPGWLKLYPHDEASCQFTAYSERAGKVQKICRDVADAVLVRGTSLMVEEEKWDKFVDDPLATEVIFTRELAIGIFKEFKTITFMGADIENSFMNIYFKKNDYILSESKIKTRFDKHDQPVKIYYMCGDEYPVWSKSFYSRQVMTIKPSEQEINYLKLFTDLIKSVTGKKKIGIQENKSFTLDVNVTGLNKTIIPFKSEGLNKYSKIDHYAELGAYLYTPEQKNMLQVMGYDVDEVQMVKSISHAYQGSLRTSLREGKDKNNMIFLPTKAMAELFKERFFPNAELIRFKHAEVFFEDVQPLTNQQKQVRRKVKKQITELVAATENTPTVEPAISMNFYRRYSDKTGLGTVQFNTFNDMTNFMIKSKITGASKESQFLFTNAGVKNDSNRSRDNVEHLNNCLILDIDGGNVTPEIFLREMKDIRTFIYTSFNHLNEAKGNENRYRVLIELSGSPKNNNEYIEMTRQLQRYLLRKFQGDKIDFIDISKSKRNGRRYTGNPSRIKNRHFSPLVSDNKKHNERTQTWPEIQIDQKSLCPEQLWYLPTENQNNPAAFKMYDNPGKPLDISMFDLEPETVDFNNFTTRVLRTKHNRNKIGHIYQHVRDAVPGNRFVHFQAIWNIIKQNKQYFDMGTLYKIQEAWNIKDPDRSRHNKFMGALVG
jgi:hypothetical protein